MMTRGKEHWLFSPYLSVVTVCGLALMGGALYQWSTYIPQDLFLLLMVLSGISAWFIITVPVEDSSITYQVGSVPALAAAALFGPLAAALGTAIFNALLWLIKPTDGNVWKKNWTQLGFNIGMHGVAAFIAGWVVVIIQNQLIDYPVWAAILPWLPAAIIYEEINIWLLIGILWLQSKGTANPIQIWKEDHWATQITIVLLSIGCGLLAYAALNFGLLGVIIFFLPILLSIYAFKLYTSRMQAHLDKLEEMVADRTQDLEELNRQKDLFLTFLTHDLMTPISSIRFSGERLKNDEGITEMGREHAELILRGQSTLHNMVSNILDIEKLRVGERLSSHKELILMQELMFNTTELMRPQAFDKEISFSVDLCIEPQIVLVDQQQIERVLFNLISNALKYTPVGGAVSVTLTQDGDWTVVAVQDTGYGIPKEVQDTVFKKYVRVKSLEGKAMGTGLGLAISKELVLEHSGTLTVNSMAGRGSTFVLRLPLNHGLEDYDD